MKTKNLKSVITGLVATVMITCSAINAQANTVTILKSDTGKMAKKDKMAKDKMMKDKMSKDKMTKDKMSEGKMAQKDTASKM